MRNVYSALKNLRVATQLCLTHGIKQTTKQKKLRKKTNELENRTNSRVIGGGSREVGCRCVGDRPVRGMQCTVCT